MGNIHNRSINLKKKKKKRYYSNYCLSEAKLHMCKSLFYSYFCGLVVPILIKPIIEESDFKMC